MGLCWPREAASEDILCAVGFSGTKRFCWPADFAGQEILWVSGFCGPVDFVGQ